MIEKRRSKRLPIKLTLEVSSLFKQDNVDVENINAPIEVNNVSRVGIGFTSESVLPIGYYFNARLELGKEDNALNCVIKIIRQEQKEEGLYYYGCEYVGLANVLYYIFDEYEKLLDNKEEI